MTGYLLFSEILFRRLYHFGNGEERLRGDKGQDSTHHKEHKGVGADRRRWAYRAGRNVHNSESHTHEADKYGNISDCFKNLSRAVEPLKKGFDFFHKTKLVEFWRKVMAFCEEVIGTR